MGASCPLWTPCVWASLVLLKKIQTKGNKIREGWMMEIQGQRGEKGVRRMDGEKYREPEGGIDRGGRGQ